MADCSTLVEGKILCQDGKYYLPEDVARIDGVFYSKSDPAVVYCRSTRRYQMYDPRFHYSIKTSDGVEHFYDKRKLTRVFRGRRVIYIHNRDYVYDFVRGRDPLCTDDGRNFFDSYEVAVNEGYLMCMKRRKLVEKSKAVTSLANAMYYKFPNLQPRRLHPKSSTYLGTSGMKYTFGVEIETSRTMVHPAIAEERKLNMECVYDGSLKDSNGDCYGGEYVTGVLQGDTGLQDLRDCLKTISEYSMIDSRCGIHVHIGGFESNPRFNVAAYHLGRLLESEMLGICPPSRHHNSYASSLNEYPLVDLYNEHGAYGFEVAYEHLYNQMLNQKWYPKRKYGKEFNKFKRHPGRRYTDRYQHSDFATTEGFNHLFRYKWLNFIPCNFNTRNYPPNKASKELNRGVPLTLEFRNHSASMNYRKIRNWIVICMAFVKYVEEHAEVIMGYESFTLEEMLRATITNVDMLNSLLKYKQVRTEKFASAWAEAAEQEEYDEVNTFAKVSLKDMLCA